MSSTEFVSKSPHVGFQSDPPLLRKIREIWISSAWTFLCRTKLFNGARASFFNRELEDALKDKLEDGLKCNRIVEVLPIFGSLKIC